MLDHNALFSTVIKEYALIVEERDGLIIKKGFTKSKAIQNYRILIIGSAILGLIFLRYVSAKSGIYFMMGAGILFFYTLNMRQREKDNAKKSIEINEQEVIIRDGFKAKRIALEEVAELRTNVIKKDILFVGSITLITDDNKQFEFLEIIGKDESTLQDDLLIVSNYIVEHYMP